MGKDWIPDPNKNPYRVKQTPSYSGSSVPDGTFIDFNTQRVCPSCAGFIKIDHNFCKYCGVDLSEIEPIGKDDILRPLAITAATDPDASVRKEALDTIGSFKEKKALGLFTYALFNDPSPACRKEAADELGDLHHPYSLGALTKALKDQDPDVRKEAIEGLKKIKEKTKKKDHDKGKPEEREEEKKEEKDD